MLVQDSASSTFTKRTQLCSPTESSFMVRHSSDVGLKASLQKLSFRFSSQYKAARKAESIKHDPAPHVTPYIETFKVTSLPAEKVCCMCDVSSADMLEGEILFNLKCGHIIHSECFMEGLAFYIPEGIMPDMGNIDKYYPPCGLCDESRCEPIYTEDVQDVVQQVRKGMNRSKDGGAFSQNTTANYRFAGISQDYAERHQRHLDECTINAQSELEHLLYNSFSANDTINSATDSLLTAVSDMNVSGSIDQPSTSSKILNLSIETPAINVSQNSPSLYTASPVSPPITPASMVASSAATTPEKTNGTKRPSFVSPTSALPLILNEASQKLARLSSIVQNKMSTDLHESTSVTEQYESLQLPEVKINPETGIVKSNCQKLTCLVEVNVSSAYYDSPAHDKDSADLLQCLSTALESAVNYNKLYDFSKCGQLRFHGLMSVSRDTQTWQNLHCYLYDHLLLYLKVSQSFTSVKGSVSVNHITHLSFTSRTLTLRLSVPDLPLLHLSGEHAPKLYAALIDRSLVININPRTVHVRPPVDIVIAIPTHAHVSTKHSIMKRAVANFLKNMNTYDRLSLVLYGSVHSMAIGPYRASWSEWPQKLESIKDEMLHRTTHKLALSFSKVTCSNTDSLFSKGCDDEEKSGSILDSIKASFVQLSLREAPNPVTSIYLISDSISKTVADNNALNSIREKARKLQISIRSFGIGDYHSPDVLTSVSNTYCHVREWPDLQDTLVRSLKKDQNYTHRNVSLNLSSNYKIMSADGETTSVNPSALYDSQVGKSYFLSSNKNQPVDSYEHSIHIDHLGSGDSRVFVVELALDSLRANSITDLMTATVICGKDSSSQRAAVAVASNICQSSDLSPCGSPSLPSAQFVTLEKEILQAFEKKNLPSLLEAVESKPIYPKLALRLAELESARVYEAVLFNEALGYKQEAMECLQGVKEYIQRLVDNLSEKDIDFYEVAQHCADLHDTADTIQQAIQDEEFNELLFRNYIIQAIGTLRGAD